MNGLWTNPHVSGGIIIQLFVACLIHTTTALYSKDCMLLRCGQSSSNNCMSVSGFTVTINPCSQSSMECSQEAYTMLSEVSNLQPYTPQSCTLVESQDECGSQSDLAHGMKCCTNINCASGKCTAGFCEGRLEGEACDIDEQCAAQLYCTAGSSGTQSGQCKQITLKRGDSCQSSSECPPGSGCNIGVCTTLSSLEDGAFTNSSHFCKSQISKDNTCEKIIVRIQGEKIDHPYPCNIGETCNYFWEYNGGMVNSIACPCNGNSEGPSHCLWIEGMNLESYDQEWFEFEESNCSGAITHQISFEHEECGQITQGDLNEYKALQAVHKYWPLYMSGAIDECAEEMGMFDPSTQDESGAVHLVLGLGVVIFLIL